MLGLRNWWAHEVYSLEKGSPFTNTHSFLKKNPVVQQSLTLFREWVERDRGTDETLPVISADDLEKDIAAFLQTSTGDRMDVAMKAFALPPRAKAAEKKKAIQGWLEDAFRKASSATIYDEALTLLIFLIGAHGHFRGSNVDFGAVQRHPDQYFVLSTLPRYANGTPVSSFRPSTWNVAESDTWAAYIFKSQDPDSDLPADKRLRFVPADDNYDTVPLVPVPCPADMDQEDRPRAKKKRAHSDGDGERPKKQAKATNDSDVPDIESEDEVVVPQIKAKKPKPKPKAPKDIDVPFTKKGPPRKSYSFAGVEVPTLAAVGIRKSPTKPATTDRSDNANQTKKGDGAGKVDKGKGVAQSRASSASTASSGATARPMSSADRLIKEKRPATRAAELWKPPPPPKALGSGVIGLPEPLRLIVNNPRSFSEDQAYRLVSFLSLTMAFTYC